MSNERDSSGWRRRLSHEVIPMIELLGHYCDTAQFDEAMDQLTVIRGVIAKAKIDKHRFEEEQLILKMKGGPGWKSK